MTRLPAALANAIDLAPDDERNYLVLADHLQAQADPRGEWISLQHAGLPRTPAGQAARRRAQACFKRHRDAFLGDLGDFPKGALTLKWHLGYVRFAAVDQRYRSGFNTEEGVRRLLAHPSSRFLRELMVGRVDRDQNDYRSITKLLGETPRPSMRTLWVGVSDGDGPLQTMLGNVERFSSAFPNLEALLLTGNGLELGDIRLPLLRELSIDTWALSAQATASLAKARWPSLESLTVDFGPNVEGVGPESLQPIFDATDFPKLTRLCLKRFPATDAACALLATSRLARQLKVLDMTLSKLSDSGAQALASGSFPELTVAVAPYSSITKVGKKALQSLCRAEATN